MSTTTLAPSILAHITRFLELHDMIKLARLCGNSHLIRMCVVAGGVAELVVKSGPAERYVTLFGARLPSFRLLTSLSITLSDLTLDAIPGIANWLVTLPPTMRKMELDYAAQTDAFLRPVAPALDDDETLFLYSLDGMTPLDLQRLFPNLQQLHLLCRREMEENQNLKWTSAMVRRFLARLPTSLTSLQLPLALLHNKYDRLHLPPPEVLRNLEFFAFSSYYFHTLPFGALLPPYYADTSHSYYENLVNSGDEAKMDELFASYENLISLRAPVTFVDASFSLVSRFRNLQTLELSLTKDDMAGRPLVLPGSLTRLRIVILIKDIDMGASIKTAPHLTSCHIFVAVSQSPVDITFLPPKITDLTIKTANFSPYRLLCPLPLGLTRLCIGSGVDIDLKNLLSANLPRLTSLTAPWRHLLDENSSNPLVLPPSVVSLNLGTDAINIKLLKLLPKTVTELEGDVKATDCKQDFENLKIFTDDSVKERLRLLYLPHITSAKCRWRLVLDIVWTKLPELVEVRQTTITLMKLTKALNPRLTHLQYDGLDSLQISDLPAGLIEFNSPGTRFQLPPSLPAPALDSQRLVNSDDWIDTLDDEPRKSSPQRKRDSDVLPVEKEMVFVNLAECLQQAEYRLPSNLETLCCSPQNVYDTQDFMKVLLWPLLETAPKLTSLSILQLKHENLAALQHMPATITRLEMGFFWPTRTYTVAPVAQQLFSDSNWLPSLLHLSVKDILFPLGALIPMRMSQLRTLSLRKAFVSADLFIWPNPLKIDEMSAIHVDNSYIAHHCLFTLFPPHLRSNIDEISLEWSATTLFKMANDERITSLTLQQTDETSSLVHHLRTTSSVEYAADTITSDIFGSDDDAPSGGLITNGEKDTGPHKLPICYLSAEHLPPALTALDIVKCSHLQFASASQLPQSLTKLQANWSWPRESTPLSGMWPSSLTDLTLHFNGALTESIAASLPRALRSLALHYKMTDSRVAKKHFSPRVFAALPPLLKHLTIPTPPDPLSVLPKSLISLHIVKPRFETYAVTKDKLRADLPLLLLYRGQLVDELP